MTNYFLNNRPAILMYTVLNDKYSRPTASSALLFSAHRNLGPRYFNSTIHIMKQNHHQAKHIQVYSEVNHKRDENSLK